MNRVVDNKIFFLTFYYNNFQTYQKVDKIVTSHIFTT